MYVISENDMRRDFIYAFIFFLEETLEMYNTLNTYFNHFGHFPQYLQLICTHSK